MRSARPGFLVPIPNGVDLAEAVCIPLAYLTAFQMLTRCRRLPPGATILVAEIRDSLKVGAEVSIDDGKITSDIRER